MKKVISALLALAMILSIVPFNVFAEEKTAYSDMKTTDYYAIAATALSELDIIEGYPDGTFGAEKGITRAEVAAIACRMIDKSKDAETAKGQTKFDDVAIGYWASGYINVAAQENIINGDGDGNFRPEDDITYEEAIKIIICVLGLGKDIKVDPADWSAGYLAVAKDKGLTKDLKGKKGDVATRGDVAVMTYNGMTFDLKAPVASLEAGSYTGTKSVTLKTETEGAEIYYTTDGSAPTVKSTKYTKAISISKTTTLKAIAVKKGALVSDVMSVEYTIKRSSGGGSRGGGSSTVSTYTVSFDLNYEGATGVPDKQSIDKGSYATMPDDPERSGFAFMGWHISKDKQEFFDFDNTAINSNLIIYAQWVDITDTTDTDSDGLTDSYEAYFGTDKTKADTDDDGLNDYFELYTVNTDPLNKDTDGNGITDNLEDEDEDKLNNEEEYGLGTNAIYYDSDHDQVSDYDEINTYGTNPLKADTDGDGVTDGDEIAIGSNPLVAETTFTTQTDFGEPTEDSPISIKVDAVTNAEGAGSLEVETIMRSDNYLVPDTIAGYLGYAYNLTTDGELESAELTFSYDKSLGEIGDDFQPRIYYLNEETGEFEELPGQVVTAGQVVAKTTHFSTYILLNKVEFDKVWDAEIKTPVADKDQISGLDIAFVIDSSGSMSDNDSSGLRKTLTRQLIEKLSGDDRAAIIDFDRSTYVYAGFTSDKSILSSAVNRIDSDGGTIIYNGIVTALEQFDNIKTANDDDRLKYMFVLTDGEDDYGNYTAQMYSELAEQAKNNSIAIYTIGLGNGVNETLLKTIAEVSGGKYYFASVSTDLSDIFSDFEFETIDYITDSNKDGISDYYTKLINDGDLCLTNTSYELIGCTDIFGEESADWDGDGLLNGEEIEIIIGSNGQPKIKMNSHPFWADYDCDGYSDYEEVKEMNTAPLKYTLPYKQEYDKLIGNSSIRYYATFLSDNYTSSWFDSGVTNVFDWNKTEESEKILIDYFYDYASEESVNANAKEIEKQAKAETIISAVNNILSITKNLKGITDATTGISELDRKQEKVANFRANVFKGLPEIFKCANKKDTETALKLVSSTMSDIKSGAGIVEDFNNTAEGILDTTETITGDISGVLKIGKDVFTLMYKDGRMIDLPLPKAFTKFSQKYTKWMGSDAFAGLDKAQVVSIAFDVVDLASDSAELYATYSKLQANTEAYIEYIESIDYISTNGNDVGFIKDAAGEVMIIVLKDGNFMQELTKAIGQKSVKTFISVTTDILAKNPYVAVVKAAIDLGISLSGITKLTAAKVESIMADSISDAFIYMLDLCVTSDDWFYISVSSYDEATKYLAQLSQSRIYGENIAKSFYDVKSVSTWLADLTTNFTGNMTTEEILDEINDNILSIYNTAKYMNLTLSPKLPKYNGNGGGGGAW